MLSKLQNQQRRRQRIRARVTGTAERPRLTVNVSSSHISAQLVDDSRGATLAASDSRTHDKAVNLTEKAEWVGSDIASKAKQAKISRVVFDRNGRKYHGRIKALADKARLGGLEF